MKKGDIILIYFPFTNFESAKLRPAIVLIPENKYGDVCLAFITSKVIRDDIDALVINQRDKDFKKTGLKVSSTIKVGKIVTLHKDLIAGKIGGLSKNHIKKLNEILKKIFQVEKNNQARH